MSDPIGIARMPESPRDPDTSEPKSVPATGAPEPPEGPRHRGRAILVAVGLVGAIAVAAVAIAAADEPTGSVDPAASPTRPPATAAVERRSLAVTEDLTGTLGYDGEMSLVGNLHGTLTKVAAVGDLLSAGDIAYEVDGKQRATVMIGSRPAWRVMESGISNGADIKQLEQNLVALGYGSGVKVDSKWTSATTKAVKRWQKARGLSKDGVVDLGEVVFLPEAVRVTEHDVELGFNTGPGSSVLKGTSARQVISLDLAADRQEIVNVGDAVAVTMPDGSEVPGTVSEIGRVATATEDVFGQAGTPTVEVTVTIDDGPAAAALDGAPVTIVVTRSSRPSALAVPVNALLALLEGGYAVEVMDADGSTRLVGVETGIFDDGWVEVTGVGLDEGLAVVVPS
jgi:peptidoglycan hydrolase-like protein with peptidoglycan-binding domain